MKIWITRHGQTALNKQKLMQGLTDEPLNETGIQQAKEARKKIEDIEYIKNTVGLERLSENLRDIAYARLEEPDATLKELGEKLSSPVGKSGVNHRLRKLSQIAQDIREKGHL